VLGDVSYQEAEEYSAASFDVDQARECLAADRIKKPVIYRRRATLAPEPSQFDRGHHFDASLTIPQIATSMGTANFARLIAETPAYFVPAILAAADCDR
jgi:hypothetical protein